MSKFGPKYAFPSQNAIQECVYHTDIHSADERKQWHSVLVQNDQDIIDTATDHFCERLRTLVRVKDSHFQHTM